MPKLIPVILSGGAGSRLWPVSRAHHPKPFIRLADGQTLIQKAFLRAIALPFVDDILVVTHRELLFKTRDAFFDLTIDRVKSIQPHFILEPFGRNTAPAIATASLHIAEQYGDDTHLLILTADHLITDQNAFMVAVSEAIVWATSGKLVTFGIKPDAPEVGYGYIEYAEHQVIRFIEKPSLEKAIIYAKSPRFLWNAGMFCFSATHLLREMEAHCPVILATTRRAFDAKKRFKGEGFTWSELDADHFKQVPDDSIDYAVMERSKQVAVVPCQIGWRDIGSWPALGALSAPDADGNHVQGEVLLHDTQHCIVQSDSRLVAALGLHDLMIIDTADALLVADKKRAAEVKCVFSKLKQMGHATHQLHRKVHRPWGTYTVLEEGEGFKIKRIEVKPGAKLSLQMHHHRSEHWIVVCGTAKVVNNKRTFLLKTNQSTYIPVGHRHRLENPEKGVLVLIEVQSGAYLREDDIVRFDDAYGRVGEIEVLG